MAAQVVVKSTFLDVEERCEVPGKGCHAQTLVVIFQVIFWPKKIQEPSLLERFRRLRRAVTEPELESGMERYEPGKFSWGTRG